METSTPLDGLKEVAIKQNRGGEMGVFDWQMFAGNVKRNAQTPGGTPFMEPKWKITTAKTNESKNALKMSENYMVQQRQQAMIPGFFPFSDDHHQERAENPSDCLSQLLGHSCCSGAVGKIRVGGPIRLGY